ncbi:MAG: nitrate/nitrite transporter NrtS [Mycobacteriaceae bacterium]
MAGAADLTWCTPGEAVRIATRPRHLWRTGLTALIIGTILFAINHLDTVLRGDATAGTWVEIGVTYLVPFAVANIGLLIGSHRLPADPDQR